MLDHFRFVKENTRHLAKMTIPSPSMVHYRAGRDMIDRAVYPDMESFYSDLGGAYAGRSAPSPMPVAAICSSTT